LVFEDSPSGVQAGKAAGMTVVSVPDKTMYSTHPEAYNLADYIIDSLEAFQLEQFYLPKYD